MDAPWDSPESGVGPGRPGPHHLVEMSVLSRSGRHGKGINGATTVLLLLLLLMVVVVVVVDPAGRRGARLRSSGES